RSEPEAHRISGCRSAPAHRDYVQGGSGGKGPIVPTCLNQRLGAQRPDPAGIVLNLVSNAVRYTVSGGVVIGCRRRADSLRIEVWDSGPGIPEDQRGNIFREFYRLAGTKGGLGLGLAIVDRLGGLLDHPIE